MIQSQLPFTLGITSPCLMKPWLFCSRNLTYVT